MPALALEFLMLTLLTLKTTYLRLIDRSRQMEMVMDILTELLQAHHLHLQHLRLYCASHMLLSHRTCILTVTASPEEPFLDMSSCNSTLLQLSIHPLLNFLVENLCAPIVGAFWTSWIHLTVTFGLSAMLYFIIWR